jgi:hypothetical protein
MGHVLLRLVGAVNQDLLGWRELGGICEKIYEEAPWVPACRIGTWKLPQDDACIAISMNARCYIYRYVTPE